MKIILNNHFFSSKFNINRPFFIYAFCLFISVLLLLFATKSSPLYPFNDWVDVNASFTMGKAMMNGRVLYRDIFNQKGPLHYLLFGLAYLIANTTFIGVYIIEVLAFSFFLFYSYKILILYINIEYALICIPILAAIVLNLDNFSHGGSPEEFCLPLITISLFYLVNYFKNCFPKPIPYRWVFINGSIAGCVLWIKYSMLGFWFGWILSILLCMLIKQEYNRVLKGAMIFLTGILFATLPWLFYFGVNYALLDLINSYFLINITNYSRVFSLITIFQFTFAGILIHLTSNHLSVGFLYFGLIVFLKYKKFYIISPIRFGILFCFFFLALSVYGGGRGYIYYFLIFSPFIIFGFIVLFQMAYEKFGEFSSMKHFIFIIVLLLFGVVSYLRIFHHNVDVVKISKEDFVQYQYAQIINQTENATLLNYGSLDGGFYTTTGIVPNIRFFQNLNIDQSRFPLIMDEQNRYIKEQIVDYIVIRIEPNEYYEELDIPHLDKNFILIEKKWQEYENEDFYYLLFKKIN